MELRTHTNLWTVEKKLYKLYDITLPMPISIRQLGILFGFGIPWFIFMKFTPIPFSPPFGYLVWLAPPGLLAYVANKPMLEGKKLFDLVSSQVGYWFEARLLARLTPSKKEETVHAYAEVWHRGTAPAPVDVTHNQHDPVLLLPPASRGQQHRQAA